ncbi:hypothetical protein GEMRC1_005720 [Eukaryota sp. GEM-RC1]
MTNSQPFSPPPLDLNYDGFEDDSVERPITSISLARIENASSVPVSLVYARSQNSGSKLTMDPVTLYFQDLDDCSFTSLSTLFMCHFTTTIDKEGCHVHPESKFEFYLKKNKEYFSSLKTTVLHRWINNCLDSPDSPVAFIVKVEAYNISASALKKYEAFMTSKEHRSFTPEVLRSKNPSWDGEDDAWIKFADLYGKSPQLSAVGIPAELIDLFWRKIDDRNGLTDQELIHRVAENIAQRLSISYQQLIAQVHDLLTSHFDSINLLLPSQIRSVLSAAEQEQSMSTTAQQEDPFMTPINHYRRTRLCKTSFTQLKKTSNENDVPHGAPPK